MGMYCIAGRWENNSDRHTKFGYTQFFCYFRLCDLLYGFLNYKIIETDNAT